MRVVPSLVSTFSVLAAMLVLPVRAWTICPINRAEILAGSLAGIGLIIATLPALLSLRKSIAEDLRFGSIVLKPVHVVARISADARCRKVTKI